MKLYRVEYIAEDALGQRAKFDKFFLTDLPLSKLISELEKRYCAITEVILVSSNSEFFTEGDSNE